MVDGFLPTFSRRNLFPPRLGGGAWSKPSQKAGIPERVIIPFQEAISMPCKITVHEGDRVKAGEKIGFMGNGDTCIAVHASTSGRVDQIAPMPHPLGFNALSVVIASDGKDEGVEAKPLGASGIGSNKEKMFEALREMGIPLNYPLLAKTGFAVSRLLINATEFEPPLTSGHHLIKEHGPHIIEGLKVLLSACSASQAVILIEKDRPSLIKTLKGFGSEVPAITIRGVNHPYPDTAVGYLAKKLFSKKPYRITADRRTEVMTVDLSSLFAIYNAWFWGMPLTEQLITVVGSAIPNPQNSWVKIGTPLASLVQSAGGTSSPLGQITLGGPLMGLPQSSLEVPIIKKTKGVCASVALLFDERRRSRFYKRVPCIKCAKCVDVCPVSIIPNLIADFIDNRFFSDAARRGVFLCAECGLCEYVCPSRIPLLELMKLGKVSLKGEQSLLTQSNLKLLS